MLSSCLIRPVLLAHCIRRAATATWSCRSPTRLRRRTGCGGRSGAPTCRTRPRCRRCPPTRRTQVCTPPTVPHQHLQQCPCTSRPWRVQQPAVCTVQPSSLVHRVGSGVWQVNRNWVLLLGGVWVVPIRKSARGLLTSARAGLLYMSLWWCACARRPAAAGGGHAARRRVQARQWGHAAPGRAAAHDAACRAACRSSRHQRQARTRIAPAPCSLARFTAPHGPPIAFQICADGTVACMRLHSAGDARTLSALRLWSAPGATSLGGVWPCSTAGCRAAVLLCSYSAFL